MFDEWETKMIYHELRFAIIFPEKNKQTNKQTKQNKNKETKEKQFVVYRVSLLSF